MPMPAIRRYDGPFFRAVRRGLAAGCEVETYVLSARFGLIHSDTEVPWYDQRLGQSAEPAFAEGLQVSVSQLAESGRFTTAFVCAGHKYLGLLGTHLDRLRAVAPVTTAAGGLGEKLTRLRGWLSDPRSVVPYSSQVASVVKVRGVEVPATESEVMALAREAVRNRERAALKCHGWHVPVDGAAVAPKWLIHKLTGLPVGRFHSDDARRALAALGVRVVSCT